MHEELTQIARDYHSAVGGIAEFLQARGITEQVAARHLLGFVRTPAQGHTPYAGRLSIPYVTPSGVVDMRFRAVRDDDAPKYLSMPGRKGRLYNTVAICDAQPVVGITEGELDACVIQHYTGLPCVGLPGATTWQSNVHARVFAGFGRVLVFTDGDTPGRELGNKIARDVSQARVIDMGDGLDATEVLLRDGVDGLRERVGL